MNYHLIRIAVYIRVSSEEQAKTGDSIRDQRESCLDYINGRKDAILQDVYLDDGISGQKLDRDEFQRLLAAVRDGLVDMIIFTKLDRWFRNLRHYLNTQATLEKYNVSWLAVDQPYYDTSTPHGRAFVAQSMMWAELEAQNGGIRIKSVFENKVKYGEVISGKVPRGYSIQDKHLVPNEEADMIRAVFQHFCVHRSLNAALKFLAVNYGVHMTLNNLKKSILQNTKYIGLFRDNPDYCPAIITKEVWEETQRILNSRLNIKSNQRYTYIFSGLLVCDECGRRMGGAQINVLSTKKSGKQHRYRYPAYECKQYRMHRCENGGEIREVRIEEYLLEHIRDEMSAWVATYEAQSIPVIDNRARKASLARKLERLKALYLNEVISLEEYKCDRMSYLQELESLPDVVEAKTDITRLKKLLNSDFETLYGSFNNEEKRQFWGSIIKEIRVTKSHSRHRNYTIIFL